jgi:hypothetical protein
MDWLLPGCFRILTSALSNRNYTGDYLGINILPKALVGYLAGKSSDIKKIIIFHDL